MGDSKWLAQCHLSHPGGKRARLSVGARLCSSPDPPSRYGTGAPSPWAIMAGAYVLAIAEHEPSACGALRLGARTVLPSVLLEVSEPLSIELALDPALVRAVGPDEQRAPVAALLIYPPVGPPPPEPGGCVGRVAPDPRYDSALSEGG